MGMNWIVGILVGAWLGGILAGGGGALAGAALALVAIQNWNKTQDLRQTPERLRILESRVATLEAELAARREGTSPIQSEADASLASQPVQEESVPAPTPPAVDATPGELDALYQRFRAWLFGGNTLVRVGVLVLFFGLAFLARYAADRGLVPAQLRLAGIAAGGVALLVAGWRLRERRSGYALSLQGGGVAVLYLTVFAALRLYDLLPAGLAFTLLLAIVALSALLAILQNAPALAVIGSAGGFVAPILASTGQGSHIQLFSYYTLLNAGVLLMAWRRAWRLLNLVGFAFTFMIGLAWGARYYQPAFLASTEPFLIVFFLMYLAAAVFYAFRHAPDLKHYVDGTLVFGLPVVAFGLQAGLVRELPFALAWSALALGGLYVLLARWLHARHDPRLELLVEAFLALGVAFLTLAIPLALEGRWTAAAWALEGAALVWVGQRQGRRLASAAGFLLQLAAGLAFVDGGGLAEFGRTLPVFNSHCLGALLLALAGLFAGRLAHARRHPWPWLVPAGWLMLAWGGFWWVAGGLTELSAQLVSHRMPAASLLFLAASATLGAWVARRAAWDQLALAGLAGLPGMALSLLLSGLHGQAPGDHLGWLAWPLALALHFRALAWSESSPTPRPLLPAWHGIGVWVIALTLGWELAERLADLVPGSGWALAQWGIAGSLALGLVVRLSRQAAWPLTAWGPAYLAQGAGGVAAALLAWGVGASAFSNGDARPLAYLPLLNPLDLATALMALAVLHWRQHLADWAEPPRWQGFILPTLGAALFLAASAAVLRATHHLAGVPYALGSLLASATAQAALSLFWGLTGLVLMLLASRRGLRPLWIAGAGLMALVVAKLFLVDMAASGTLPRIVSFIGAGLLLLVVGYFSPLPPKEEQA
jgi:uncharacterized membrane protein